MSKTRKRAVRQIVSEKCSEVLPEIFTQAQYNSSYHEDCIKKLKKVYEKSDFDDFFKSFIKLLVIPMQYGHKALNVNCVLEFAAKFATSLIPPDDPEGQTCPFFEALMKFLLEYHNARGHGFRFRLCELIGRLLTNLGENVEVDDSLYDDIQVAMLTRLQDIKHQVRTQAVIALHRLQNPQDPTDPVTKAYLFHMECDPSPQVRRSVINNIARSKDSLAHVLKRTRDADDKVRRDAYNFMSLLTFKAFKISQRAFMLKNGLQDRAPMVKKCVSEVLLSKWLLPYKDNFFEFLQGLKIDASIEDLKKTIHVSNLVLDSYIRNNPTQNVIEILPLNPEKVLHLEKTTHESVIYWRHLVQFFYQQSMEDELESVVPELTVFCKYIKTYCETKNEKLQKWEELEHQSILAQLFEMTTYLDLSDEFGRNSLWKLICDMLQTMKLHDFVIDVMIARTADIKPDLDKRINQLMELISDIIEPMETVFIPISEEEQRANNMAIGKLRLELNILADKQQIAVDEKDFATALTTKDEITAIRNKIQELTYKPPECNEVRTKCTDPVVWCKVLDIIIATLHSKSVTRMTPTLRSVQQHIVMEDCITNGDPRVFARALRCIGMFGCLDINIAKNAIPLFYVPLVASKLGGSHKQVVLSSLKALIDLLLVYGLEAFASPQLGNAQSENKDESNNQSGNRTKRCLYNNTQSDDEDDDNDPLIPGVPLSASSNEFIGLITSLLDHDIVEIRTAAADGLCRMLITGKIKSPALLSRLIILWFNPATEQDIELRQVVGIMLSNFTQITPDSHELLEQAFLPTLRVVFDAPTPSPLVDIDVGALANFIITHTRPGFHKYDSINVHNSLALAICDEILKKPERPEVMHLVKALLSLQISDDDSLLKQSLYNLSVKMVEKVSNKLIIKLITKFMDAIFQEPNVETETANDNAENIADKSENMPNNSDLEHLKTPNAASTRLTIDVSTRRSSRSQSSRASAMPTIEETHTEAIDSDDDCAIDTSCPNLTTKNVVISTSESDDPESSSDSDEGPKLISSNVRRSLKRRNKKAKT